jgi:hypothetical protein
LKKEKLKKEKSLQLEIVFFSFRLAAGCSLRNREFENGVLLFSRK